MADTPAPARPELLALLEAARANPHDLNLRLVLADWLDEHGDGTRAELVRAQCEMAGLAPYEGHYYDFLAREGELLNRNTEAWLGPLAKFPVTFHRGLLRLEAAPEQLAGLAHLADTEAWAWVETLRPVGLEARHGPLLDGLPLLKSITGLDLSGMVLGEGVAAMLGRCQALSSLVEVNLSGATNAAGYPGPGTEWLTALLATSPLPPLTSLNLTASGLLGEAVDALATSPLLGGLTRLILDGNSLSVSRNAARSKQLANLEVLGLASTLVLDAEVRALARSPHLGNLRKLDLGTSSLAPALAGVLSSSTAWPRLESLNLGWSHYPPQLGPNGAKQLAEKPWSFPLSELSLRSAGIGDKGIKALAGAPHARSLAVLDLFGNGIGPAGAAALAGSPHFAGLVDLDLSLNRIGQAGLEALANSPHLGGLRRLSLYGCELVEADLEPLARSATLAGLVDLTPAWPLTQFDPGVFGRKGVLPNLVKLTGSMSPCNADTLGQFLELSFVPNLRELHFGAQMSVEVFEVFANSPRLSNLTVLSLSGLGLDNMATHLLASAAHLRRLTVLDLSHNTIHPSGAQALLTSSNLPCLRKLILVGDQQEEFAPLCRHFGARVSYTPFEYPAMEEDGEME